MNVEILITVGSTNPVKIAAVKEAFQAVFPNQRIRCEGIAAPSDVADQPMSDRETYTGALNRAIYCKNQVGDPQQYYVGVEGGVDQFNGQLLAFAWVVVLCGDAIGQARTATFDLPSEVAKLVLQGIELGVADDMVFGRENSKHKDGAVGLLTHGLIDRKSYYREATILALVPFRNPELFGLRQH